MLCLGSKSLFSGQVTHYQHEDQQLTLTVKNDLSIRQLKVREVRAIRSSELSYEPQNRECFDWLEELGQERIVEEVGRGQVSKVVLSMGGENALNDDVALSSLDREIRGSIPRNALRNVVLEPF